MFLASRHLQDAENGRLRSVEEELRQDNERTCEQLRHEQEKVEILKKRERLLLSCMDREEPLGESYTEDTPRLQVSAEINHQYG